MTLKHIQLAAVLLWGLQTDLWPYAIPIGIILETRFYLNRRWALTKQDFYRTADLTAVGLIGVVTFLFVNRTEYLVITTLVQWLPIVFFPLVAVLAYSTTERMSLDVIFYSLRRQREPVSQSWDMNYFYFGLCLISAATNVRQGGYYLVVVGLLLLIAMFRIRSPRYQTNAWLLAGCLIFLAAALTQQAIRSGHVALKAQTREWIANYIRNRTNPLKTKSSIGFVGEMKLSDAISFRVEPLDGARAPSLLQEATYDSPLDNDWQALNPNFDMVPHTEDFRWRIAETEGLEYRARIYLEFDRENAMVPIPTNITEMFDLPALDIRTSRFGSIQGIGLIPSPGYEVSYAAGADVNGEPDKSDEYVPSEYLAALESLTADLPDDLDAVSKVRTVFEPFRYSLFQRLPTEEPIIDFLTKSKAGHCEYFASATVLLLRHLGVPARYAVGYVVEEFNETIDMYVVRERHAHAWAIAYIDGRWQTVDTTPQIWAEEESAQSGLFRPVQDFFSNGIFVVQLWWSRQKLEDYEVELYILGGLLVLVLIWRIATSEQVILRNDDDDGAPDRHARPGENSPFFKIEAHLTATGHERQVGESFRAWVKRIDHPELTPLLSLHDRIRFDPDTPRSDVLGELDERVVAWLAGENVEAASGVG